MKRYLLFFIIFVQLLCVLPFAAQQPDFSDAIAECQNVANSSVCLGDVAFRAGDTSICNLASDAAICRQAVSESVDILCSDVIDPQACFSSWGIRGVESACTNIPAEEQAQCYIVAAAESGDYSIIERNFPDGQERDVANATVAVLAYDPSRLDDIGDNQTYDNAYVYMIVTMGIGQDIAFPDDYCDGLRGNWGGENPEDADINASLCSQTLSAIATWQNADDEERDLILEDMLEALEAGGEEAAIQSLLDSLYSNPIEAAFIRGWCRADENGVCVTGAVPIMEYDAENDIITHYPRNGPPRFYEAIEDGVYRMYYDTEITNDDGDTEMVSWYGEIVVESPELFTWQFYNHLARSIGTFSNYIPLPTSEDAVAD